MEGLVKWKLQAPFSRDFGVLIGHKQPRVILLQECLKESVLKYCCRIGLCWRKRTGDVGENEVMA